MLHIMLAYLMLFAALTNAVCLYDDFFLLLIFANAFCFHALSLTHGVFISSMIFASCTVLLFVWLFLILCSTVFLLS